MFDSYFGYNNSKRDSYLNRSDTFNLPTTVCHFTSGNDVLKSLLCREASAGTVDEREPLSTDLHDILPTTQLLSVSRAPYVVFEEIVFEGIGVIRGEIQRGTAVKHGAALRCSYDHQVMVILRVR